MTTLDLYAERYRLFVAHDHPWTNRRSVTWREAAEELGADLVVMATHVPNLTDYIWASHGGHLASHAKASVFLVRG